MTIAEAIRARLLATEAGALVADRITVLVAQQSPASRSIRVQEISRDDYPFLRGAADLRVSRVQVDVFVRKGDGDAYAVVHQIADAVRGGFAGGEATGLVGFVGVVGDVSIVAVLFAGQREFFDPDELQIVRVVLEFFCWFKAAA